MGLVGANGSGKSTLLKFICGEVNPETGMIFKLPEITIGYLPQQIKFPSKKRVCDYLSELPAKFDKLTKELADIEKKLSSSDYYNDMRKLSRLLDRQEKLIAKIEELEVDRYPKNIRAFLSKFGFSSNDFDLYIKALSGGQKKILAFAKLAMEKPDVILLDEPDNHLDIESKNFLESFIREYQGAVIIVSHDRYLLDEVVNHIVEIEKWKIDNLQW